VSSNNSLTAMTASGPCAQEFAWTTTRAHCRDRGTQKTASALETPAFRHRHRELHPAGMAEVPGDVITDARAVTKNNQSPDGRWYADAARRSSRVISRSGASIRSCAFTARRASGRVTRRRVRSVARTPSGVSTEDHAFKILGRSGAGAARRRSEDRSRAVGAAAV
jgi:hypothetical protein